MKTETIKTYSNTEIPYINKDDNFVSVLVWQTNSIMSCGFHRSNEFMKNGEVIKKDSIIKWTYVNF